MRNACRVYTPVLSAIIGLLFSLVPGGCFADRVENRDVGRVIHIIDGDSLKVEVSGDTVELRLWGIDAPEYDQPGSTSAKSRLASLVMGRMVKITVRARDRYGRSVSVVECNDVNVNEEMVRSGNAWVHPAYCREIVCKKWKRLESEARKNNLGLWRWHDPIPPWKWKSNKR